MEQSKNLLPGKPIGKKLLGTPLALFRDSSGKVQALLDRCPHRHIALSEGKVVNGQIECPYHGWKFNGQGYCTHVPGMESTPYKSPLVPAINAQESMGLIWICLESSTEHTQPIPPSPTMDQVFSFVIPARLRTTLEDAAENLLDGFHTHFVHPGLVRHDSTRQRVQATVKPIENGIEAHYAGETLQSGIVSRFFEGDRTRSLGRFRLPGIAEIEYYGRQGLNLQITAYMTPEDDDYLNIQALVSTRKDWIPQWLKEKIIRTILEPVLQQDIDILERQYNNRKRHSSAQYVVSPIDLLGPHIRNLTSGHRPNISKEKTITLYL